ncbi:MAG: hypothetical protein JXR03_00210 [Cyclobacteriaceae bacterium]
MPYNLSSFHEYFADVTPQETAALLDQILYDLVRCSELTGDYESLPNKYLGVMVLRNQFASMDENLRELWK